MSNKKNTITWIMVGFCFSSIEIFTTISLFPPFVSTLFKGVYLHYEKKNVFFYQRLKKLLREIGDVGIQEVATMEFF